MIATEKGADNQNKIEMAGHDEVDPCGTLQGAFVYLKENLIFYDVLKNELLVCCELPVEENVDLLMMNNIQCGELLKTIIRKGPTSCSKFLLALKNMEHGFYEDLQGWQQKLGPHDPQASFPYELKDYRSYFLEELQPSKTADYLLQYGVFDLNIHDEIEAVKERIQKTQLVLHYLEDKVPDCIHTFIHILEISNQGYILFEIKERRNEETLTPQEECAKCVRINYRLIRNQLHFELMWEHLRQDGVISKDRPQEDTSQRGKLVKEAIKFGSRGCASLLRCLEMQEKQAYKYALEVWKKRKRSVITREINIIVHKSDLNRCKDFLLSELEPLELSDILFEEGVLTLSDHDKIEEQDSLKKRNEVLLECLIRCPEKLDYFVYALKQTEKESILQRLKKRELDEKPALDPNTTLLVNSRDPQISIEGALPDDELTMIIQENDNPNSKINNVVSVVTTNLDVKIEVVRMTHMVIKDATSGSIIIHLCPLTDNAVRRFLTPDGRIVQTMLEKLLLSAGFRDILQKKEEYEISVKISKKEPSYDEKVNRSKKHHDIMRRKIRENEIYLLDELEPSQLTSFLVHKDQLSSGDREEVEQQRGRIQKGMILLEKIRTSANDQILDSFEEFLGLIGRKDLIDLVQVSQKDTDNHEKAEKIKGILIPNYTNVVEEIETSIIKETLRKFVDIHNINEEYKSFLPETGKSRQDRVHRFLTFVFKNDEYVLELEKVFQQNNLGHLLEDNGREEEVIEAASGMKNRSSSITLNEGVLFDCTYKIVLSNESGREKLKEKTVENLPSIQSDDVEEDFSMEDLRSGESSSETHDRLNPEHETEKSLTPNSHSETSALQRMDEKEGDPLAVIAIDIGNTYSGYAFSVHGQLENNPTNIFSFTNWIPETGGLITSKTPTSLLLKPNKEFYKFGYDAEDKYADLALEGWHHDYYFFQRFKMPLHGDLGPSQETFIADIAGKQLPAEDVFGHSILYLKNHAAEQMKMQGYDFDELDIRWVLPVPEVWTEAANQLIREAAQKADIKNDRLMIILESYAASLFCRYNFDAIRNESQFMVVNLEGDKADFTVYQVVNDNAFPKVYRTISGACGGTMVDVAYEQFFISIIGKDIWEEFRLTHWEDYLEIFREFEIKKRSFKRDTMTGIVVRYPVTLRELYEKNKSKSFRFAVQRNDTYSKYISLVQDKIRIEKELMEDFYSELLKKIIVHIQGMLSEPVISCTRTIILVGGFSESPIVQETLRKTFPKTQLLIPPDPELTVLKGAVMFGHMHYSGGLSIPHSTLETIISTPLIFNSKFSENM